ncbi:MAG TPA: DUF2007 domain-containing protein [Flavisolibacter sp.]
MELVTLQSFPNYIDAHIIMGRLEEEGIRCWLQDENTITINPILTNAVGGIKVMVVKDQLARALELLQQFNDERRSRLTCPVCGSNNIEFISSPRKAVNWLTAVLGTLFGDYAVASGKTWRCFTCHSEFSEPVEKDSADEPK